MAIFTKRIHKKQPPAAVTTRIVNDKRWIHSNQLKVGMYVSELDRPWEETRFMFQGFRIDSVQLLQAVQESWEYAHLGSAKIWRVSSYSDYRRGGVFSARRQAPAR
jgi:hypothetical protein